MLNGQLRNDLLDQAMENAGQWIRFGSEVQLTNETSTAAIAIDTQKSEGQFTPIHHSEKMSRKIRKSWYPLVVLFRIIYCLSELLKPLYVADGADDGDGESDDAPLGGKFELECESNCVGSNELISPLLKWLVSWSEWSNEMPELYGLTSECPNDGDEEWSNDGDEEWSNVDDEEWPNDGGGWSNVVDEWSSYPGGGWSNVIGENDDAKSCKNEDGGPG